MQNSQVAEARRPLDGVRVVDLSRILSGPLCGMLLGDMGADVLKVERPGGEDTRRVAPFFHDESIHTLTYNRNKRGMTLDTRAPEADKILERLVTWADVLIENYRPGTLANMGFPIERLWELNRGLVVTSLSGFGQSGPLREKAGFDCIAQAVSGLMSRNGGADDPPHLAGLFVADHLAGIYGALGTVLALYQRETTGDGQVVDVALLDSLFSCLGPNLSALLMLGEVAPRTGNRDPFSAPATVYDTKDERQVYIHAATAPLFARLCALMDAQSLLDDPRFASEKARVVNVDALEDVVGRWVSARAAGEVVDALDAAGIPCAVVADLEEAAANPQLAARHMVTQVPHPAVGILTLPGSVIKLSDVPDVTLRPPPQVGEHNREIYKEIVGLTDSDIDLLCEAGVI
jgi:crotonobetainyl-CoA:carnitine CoA-transferase CaiB-like acyl-CoA transferase